MGVNLEQLLLGYGGAARSCTFSNSMLRCAVWAQQLQLPGSLLAVLLAGKVLLLALHSLSHSVVEVVVARFDHLGNLLEEIVMSEVVGMAIRHGSPAFPVLLAVMVSRSPKVRDLITKLSTLRRFYPG